MILEIEINHAKRLLCVESLDEDEKFFQARLEKQDDPYLECPLLEEGVGIGESRYLAFVSFCLEAEHFGHLVNPSPFD